MDAAHGSSLPLAILYGTLSAVTLCLGKGFQKYGVDVLGPPSKMLAPGNRWRFFVWLAGTGGIVASTFLLFTACAYGPVTIAAALSGTGLVALALFSTFVLGERPRPAELGGIAAIVAGTALTGYFQPDSATTGAGIASEPILAGRLALFSSVTIGVSILGTLYSRYSEGAQVGVVLGSISGFCGGLSILFQKGSMLHCACDDLFADIPAVLRNPYFYPFVVFGVLDFVTTQYALKRARAVTVVPCYQSFYMLVPILGGMVGFAERLTALQWVGLTWLLGGVVLVSRYLGREGAVAPADPPATAPGTGGSIAPSR